ncbi:unnamed protein product [Ambrosiozyma monospora]|uniref:Unnamed protein product n=1 Tax=Ambrosiozyma monospora TaxID=43982 RepID=A0ACB5TIZ1_AMBMO|nr:unnamed protein product [Ambrosiozyma monospora]
MGNFKVSKCFRCTNKFKLSISMVKLPSSLSSASSSHKITTASKLKNYTFEFVSDTSLIGPVRNQENNESSYHSSTQVVESYFRGHTSKMTSDDQFKGELWHRSGGHPSQDSNVCIPQPFCYTKLTPSGKNTTKLYLPSEPPPNITTPIVEEPPEIFVTQFNQKTEHFLFYRYHDCISFSDGGWEDEFVQVLCDSS